MDLKEIGREGVDWNYFVGFEVLTAVVMKSNYHLLGYKAV
jgi:hypothetical protein